MAVQLQPAFDHLHERTKLIREAIQSARKQYRHMDNAAAANLEMLTVQGNHRGLIDGKNQDLILKISLADDEIASGNVVVPCSKAFLVSLALDILRARSFPLSRFADTPTTMEELEAFERQQEKLSQDQIQRIQMISAEVRRLFQCPELFPSREFRTKFAALVASDANLQFVQAVSSLLIRKVESEVNKVYQKKSAKTYLEGSKGWENFYLNMAPGVYDDARAADLKTTPSSTLQVIPGVGMRVMGDLGREEQLLLQWIRDAKLPVESGPALTTQLLDLDHPELEGRLQEQTAISQKLSDGAVVPNPFNPHERPHWDVPSQVPEPLEECTSFIGRLESLPPPLHGPVAQMHTTALFRALNVRTWHPPTQSHELRYKNSDSMPESP
ncbi:hypothetical protein RBB50_011801 [Rhinocladiella similis]